MSFIQNIKLFFHRQSLKKQLKQLRRPSGKRLPNFDQDRSLGILFDATDLEKRQEVLQFAEKLKKKNKKVHLLGFFNNRLENNNFTFNHFNRKQIDWALRPKGEAINEFLQQDFDFFIHANTQTHIYSEYIASLVNARFKVGPFTENVHCYDLMIDMKNNTTLPAYFNQIELLLEKTNTKHEAAPL